MMMGDVTSYKITSIPANSEHIILFDSTRIGSDGSQYVSTSVATGSAYLKPGTLRGMWAGNMLKYTVSVATQNVTVYEKVLVNDAAAAADWDVDGTSGTVTVTAGTPKSREWKPSNPEFQLLLTAGASAPSDVFVIVEIIPYRNFGA